MNLRGLFVNYFTAQRIANKADMYVLKHKYSKMSVKYRVPGGQVVWTFMLWPCISVNLRQKMITLIYFIIHDLQMHSCKLEPEPLWGAFLQTPAKLFHKKHA